MDCDDMVKINFSAGEILQPGASLEIKAAHSVDPRSAQGAVRLLRGGVPISATVRMQKQDRVLQVATDGLDPGSYELRVTELLDVKGKRLAGGLAVPFAMIPISGQLPPEVRVENAVRLIVGELGVHRVPPGEKAS